MKLKNKIIWFVSAVLIFNTLLVGAAFADDNTAQTTGATTQTENTEAGVTPDSPLYFLDRFVEKLQAALTFSQKAKVKLEAKLADERLSEAEKLVLEKKVEKLESVIEDYSGLIEKTQDRMTKMLEEDKNSEEAEEANNEVEKLTADDIEKLAEIFAKLPESCRDKLMKKVEKILARQEALNLAVELTTELADQHEDKDVEDSAEPTEKSAEDEELAKKIEAYKQLVADLRTNKNYGYGEIAILISLAERMEADKAIGKTEENSAETEENTADTGNQADLAEKIEALRKLREEKGMGWGQIAKAVGLHPGKKAGKLFKAVKPAKADDEDKEDQGDDKIAAKEEGEKKSEAENRKQAWKEEKEQRKLEQKKIKSQEKVKKSVQTGVRLSQTNKGQGR